MPAVATVTVRARIRQRLAVGGDSSPATVADDVIAALADDELRGALHAALPYLVRDEIRKNRFKGIGTPPSDWEGRDPGPAAQEKWERHAEPPTSPETSRRRREAGRRGAEASQKTVARRSALLQTPVSVNGEWKQLGDCTPDDLRAIARGLRDFATKYEGRALGYERLADAMDRAGAATAEAFDGAAIREAFDAGSD